MKKTFLSVNIDETLVKQVNDAKLYFDVDFSRNNIKSQWLSRTVTAIDAKNFNEIIHAVTGGLEKKYAYDYSAVKRPLKISRTLTPVKGNKVVVTEHSLA